MPEPRFFKKTVVRTPIFCLSGVKLNFLSVDGEIGIFMTDNPQLINELEACIRGERGGVSAITRDEYDELAKKKATLNTRVNSWSRIDQRAGASLVASDVKPVVPVAPFAAEPPSAKPQPPAVPERPQIAPLEVPDFEPRHGKRK